MEALGKPVVPGMKTTKVVGEAEMQMQIVENMMMITGMMKKLRKEM